jgi:predicted GIY-YIG superfamily endonuclease
MASGPWSGSRSTQSRESAFLRERQIKKWNRAWKIAMIEEGNPDWVDLYPGICG